MAAKVPIRAVFDGTTATGLAEYQTDEFPAKLVETGKTYSQIESEIDLLSKITKQAQERS